jgi:dTDP-4-amino-4,6-dideoxygalactose transaminase
MIASHGQSKRYYHDVVGCNSRLDAMQAAILDIKLEHLDEYISARTKAADFYDKVFEGISKIETPFRAKNNTHVFHQYTLIIHDANRDALHEALAAKGIPSMIYYPVPAHRQKMFDAFGGSEFELPVTDWLTERVISLPIHTELDEEQQSFIADAVKEFLK